jgi:hypothetical protein
LARLFDGNVTVQKANMTPYEYTDLADFQARVDLTMAGQAQDCAECHVGGGPMEYVPNPVMASRVPLRELYSAANVNGFGPITTGDYTAWNYFKDTWDVNNDGNLTEVLEMKWTETGVMEMDCLLCHLEGYDYDARIAMLRAAKFDASRAVGAGVAAQNAAEWGDTYYGTKVTYNSLVEQPVGGNATFSSAIGMAIKAAPPSENCGFCHFNFPGVDWKKRGDNWKKEVEAHWVLQCMGCHEGKVGSVIGTSGSASDGDLGQCDPAKGRARYSGIWNTKDNSIKTCADCHLRAGYDSTLGQYSSDYGAPDPTGAHQAYGLLGEICQDGTDGVADASHLDVIDCAACHVRKISDEVWNTGGAVVDATGNDHVGRQADHENDWVIRDMNQNLAYQWQYGKVISTGVLTTVFWRNTDGNEDVNNDGVNGTAGIDTPLTTDVLAINLDNAWTNMSYDYEGNITEARVTTRIAEFNTEFGGTTAMKMCTLSVPFIVNHNVSAKGDALGHACDDCHSAGSDGLWNGDYELQGKLMDMSYTATTQATAFTKVNSKTQATDFHPNLKNKLGTRSIAVQPFSATGANLDSVKRYELLYGGNFTADGNITSVNATSVTYTDRASWIAYLNGITDPGRTYPDANVTVGGADAGAYLHCYPNRAGCNAANSTGCWRPGNTERPGCNSTDTSACLTCWDMYDVTLFNSATFAADDVGAGAVYMWDWNDGTGQQTGNPVSHTFNSLGVKKVTLTVVDAWGIADPQMVLINVKRP